MLDFLKFDPPTIADRPKTSITTNKQMKIVRSKGQHNIWDYDVAKFPFRSYFESLFETSDLEHVDNHPLAVDVRGKMDIENHESNLHKHFYADIKSRPAFKELYCRFVTELLQTHFPEEKVLIYQSFPSVRFQYPNNVSVPKHCDSDEIGRHPHGEKNFLVPITAMHGTQRLFLESAPGREDFEGYDLEIGEFLAFNGNKCVHYNEKNTEGTVRISLDFRVMTLADYLRYIQEGQITVTNPRDPEKQRAPTKMIIGGYYQVVFRDASFAEMMNGWHFQKELLLQSQPLFDECEALATAEYMHGGGFITEFKKTEELEAKIASYTGAKHVIMTTSGTSAIMLALLAHGIGVGDNVIVPDYTMIATANAVKAIGATPLLVDVSPLTHTLDISAIEKARRMHSVKAVIHVSLNNRHSGIDELASYCASHGLLLVEDAAQSLGCWLRQGQHYGTVGSIGCFSLSTPKIISTGQGGFCTTNDDGLAAKMRMMKNFGRKCGGVDVFETFGLNMKFTDLQAVVGLEQMKKLPARVERMHQIFSHYYSMLGPIMIKPTFDGWIPWFVDIYVPDRDGLAAFLKQHNIQTRPTYPAIHTTPMYADGSIGAFPSASYVSEHGLFLPTHFALSDSAIFHICRLIRLYLGVF